MSSRVVIPFTFNNRHNFVPLKVAEEHGLELEGELASIGIGRSNVQVEKTQEVQSLEDRLAQLNSAE